MKVKLYKHSSLKTNIDDDIPKVIAYFSSPFVKQYINEEVIFDIEQTSLGYQDDNLFKPNEGIYDTVILIFEQGTFPIYGQTSNYSNKLRKCYMSVNPIEDNIDYSWKAIAHELLHSLCFKFMTEKLVFIPNLLDKSLPTPYFHNDDPYFVGGNFEQQLKELKQFYTQTYKYFKPSESTSCGHTVAELKPELVQLLDKAREIAGVPFKITSGLRTNAENTQVGGKYNSSHLTGEAVDIFCDSAPKRWLILNALLNVGFTRLEIAGKHIHCDISKTLPQNILDFSNLA